MDSLIIRWCDVEHENINASKYQMFQNNLELCLKRWKLFASLRREIYWDDLELCWNGGGL